MRGNLAAALAVVAMLAALVGAVYAVVRLRARRGIATATQRAQKKRAPEGARSRTYRTATDYTKMNGLAFNPVKELSVLSKSESPVELSESVEVLASTRSAEPPADVTTPAT